MKKIAMVGHSLIAAHNAAHNILQIVLEQGEKVLLVNPQTEESYLGKDFDALKYDKYMAEIESSRLSKRQYNKPHRHVYLPQPLEQPSKGFQIQKWKCNCGRYL